VIGAPVDVDIADDPVLQPDQVVVRADDIQGHDLEVTPLLVVKVPFPVTIVPVEATRP
jgi:hypothetical protein